MTIFNLMVKPGGPASVFASASVLVAVVPVTRNDTNSPRRTTGQTESERKPVNSDNMRSSCAGKYSSRNAVSKLICQMQTLSQIVNGQLHTCSEMA